VPVSPGRKFLSQIEFLLAFMPRNFDDAFGPRSILRTKPILQSARLFLSHSGNDRYRNLRTQPGFNNTLGMSCDNPSREANPWTTLKRTAKTKSLRFVRFCQPVSAQQKGSVSCLDGHESFAVLVNSKIVYELTRTQPSLQGTRFV